MFSCGFRFQKPSFGHRSVLFIEVKRRKMDSKNFLKPAQ